MLKKIRRQIQSFLRRRRERRLDAQLVAWGVLADVTCPQCGIVKTLDLSFGHDAMLCGHCGEASFLGVRVRRALYVETKRSF